jgi:hypothetical protein
MLTNYWLKSKDKRITTELINVKLKKFIGRNIQPVDQTFEKMRKLVVKYFRQNPEKIKSFHHDEKKSFAYSFDLEEENEIITKAEFIPD